LDVYTVDLDPNHVFNDTLTMRFYHPDNGNPSYYLCVDYLAVTTEIQGVVAYWVFDDIYHAQEGTGKTVIQDLSGNGHDLSIGGWADYNDLLTDMTGVSPIYQGGHGLRFPGVNEYLYIPAAQATDFNPGKGDFSVFFGFRTSSDITEIQRIIAKGGYLNTDFSYEIFISSDNLYFRINDGSGVRYVEKVIPISANANYTMIMSVDRDSRVFGYVNGVEVFSLSKTNSVDITNSNDFVIGKRSNANLQYFIGTVYQAAYFNRALTDQEAKEITGGLAKGWTWDGVGSISNDNFRQVVSGGGTITQTVSTTSGTMYKKSATTNDTTTVSYINEDNYTISLGDGTHDNVFVRPVLNAVKPANFVEDFSKGGAKYVEITAENQGTQSTSQIYANSTKTNYYWGDGSSAEVIGDFRVTNGNHGIMMNDLEDDQPAYPAAWKYNGIDQYVDFKNVCNVGTNDFILFAWAEACPVDDNYYTVLGKQGFGATGYNIHWKNTYRFNLSFGEIQLNISASDSYTGMNFVAVVKSKQYVRLYVNGVLKAENTSWEYLDSNFDNNAIFSIGAWVRSKNFYPAKIGLSGIYIFDGQDGAPNDLTESMEKWLIKEIYNITDGLYLQE